MNGISDDERDAYNDKIEEAAVAELRAFLRAARERLMGSEKEACGELRFNVMLEVFVPGSRYRNATPTRLPTKGHLVVTTQAVTPERRVKA